MTDPDIEQLLAWYANGTLDSEEKRQVEQYLQQHPQARLQLAEYEFMADTVSDVSLQEPQLPEDNFDSLMAQLDQQEADESSAADRQQRAASPEQGSPRPIVRPSLLEQLQQWCRETLQWGMTPAFARVVVVAQFALVAVLGSALFMQDDSATGPEGYEVLSGGNGVPASGGVQLDIAMKPQATLNEFSQLLQSVQASVISGPNTLGIYRIRLQPQDQPDSRIEQLRQHEGVSYLQPLSSATPEAE